MIKEEKDFCLESIYALRFYLDGEKMSSQNLKKVMRNTISELPNDKMEEKMKSYSLINRGGEVIKSVEAHNMEEAESLCETSDYHGLIENK